LFVWQRAPPPFRIGGAEVSQEVLARSLIAHDWSVTYLGCFDLPWGGDLRRELSEQVKLGDESDDRCLYYEQAGIRCVCCAQVDLERALVGILRAGVDVVFCSQEGAGNLARIARSSARVVGWLHSVSDVGLNVLQGDPDVVLATSRFVRDRAIDQAPALRRRVIVFYPPFVDARPDRTRRGDRLLVVNPVPAKGGDMIARLAYAMPERRFTLVQGWWDTAKRFEAIANADYLGWQERLDHLYSTHRALLVPSIVEDAFPRVIVEAGLHGLPSIASNVGGIPEGVGDAGLLVAPDDLRGWVDAIGVLDSQPYWTQLSDKGRLHAARFVRDVVDELRGIGVLPGVAT
jgi:glycosyltransferase involved in cell wall biosynthesis